MPLPITFTPNTSSPQSIPHQGIKIAQQGYNALSASNANLIFSSSWPSMTIAFEINISSNYTTPIPHNLGFTPFTMGWTLGDTTPPALSRYYSHFLPDVDDKYIYIQSYTVNTPCNIKCFNIDLTKDIDYPTLPTTTPTSLYNPDYGIKLVKQGKSINSKDGRDFIIHSKYRSPLIQAVKTQVTSVTQTNGPLVGYINPLGSSSWIYGYVLSSGKYVNAPLYGNGGFITRTDGINTYLQYIGYTGATLVILRDPMIANNIVNATY